MSDPKRILTLLLALLLFSCGTGGSGVLDRYARLYGEYPDFSLVLVDMQKVGALLPSYHHKYKIVYGDAAKEDLNELSTDWVQVDKKTFERHEGDLGMTLLSRSEGGETSRVAQPPGYQYVGNERYGQWRDDGRGGSFWEFYGKWMFMSHMFNMFAGPPISRMGYNDYRSNYSRGRAWYGSGGQQRYGTDGSLTRKTSKSFYDRGGRSAFGKRVGTRMGRSAKAGRSRSGMRGRSGGFGK